MNKLRHDLVTGASFLGAQAGFPLQIRPCAKTTPYRVFHCNPWRK